MRHAARRRLCSVRVFDYAKRTLEHTASFSQPATVLIGLDPGHTVRGVCWTHGEGGLLGPWAHMVGGVYLGSKCTPRSARA